MTQEDKELLLKDLCARLPYRVKIFYTTTITIAELKTINAEKGTCIAYDCSQWYRHSKWSIENIKPYLRSLSSITEDEKKEAHRIFTVIYDRNDVICGIQTNSFEQLNKMTEWLNKHHFDYRGLIEKGLALEAPEGMYEY